MKLTTSVFTFTAIVLAGGSFAFSSNECNSGFYKHSCADGICGDMVPLECLQEHIDSNTQVALLDQPIPIKDTKQAELFIAQGYDIECPFTVNSNNSCQAINPISIFQLHYPQEWPSPLDIFFEQLIPFPQIYYSVSWREIPIKSDAKSRRQLRTKELNAAIAKFQQLEKNPKFIKMKLLLQTYGANFSPPHPTSWKPEYRRGF